MGRSRHVTKKMRVNLGLIKPSGTAVQNSGCQMSQLQAAITRTKTISAMINHVINDTQLCQSDAVRTHRRPALVSDKHVSVVVSSTCS